MLRLRTAAEAIPIVGFIASQSPTSGAGLPEGIAGPAGLLILGVYATVYVAKAVTEMRNGNGGKPQNGAVMAASIAHVQKTLDDLATDMRTMHVRLDAHGDRLTRNEASCANNSVELQRIRKEGCQQLQKHMNVLRDIRTRPED